MQDARLAEKKVQRTHIPRYENRKWTTVYSLLYPYDKIKGDFELQGLFTKMKTKCWMCVYFDMLLLYTPSKDGPPVGDDKKEELLRPFDYFFLDNVDSDKITHDEAKMWIDLPTSDKKESLRIQCDSAAQFKEWLNVVVSLCKVFETTPRDQMHSREEVEKHMTEIQRIIPMAFEPMGFAGDNVEYSRGVEWMDEMRKHYENQRKFLPYINRVERFSAFRIGSVSVYCNFFLGRDRDGPLEILEKAKKRVFTYWEAEVERIMKLNETVLGEDSIDKDHLPFHKEDCQIGCFLIDLMNAYSKHVHGVDPNKIVLQKSAATLEEQWKQLQQAKTH